MSALLELPEADLALSYVLRELPGWVQLEEGGRRRVERGVVALRALLATYRQTERRPTVEAVHSPSCPDEAAELVRQAVEVLVDEASGGALAHVERDALRCLGRIATRGLRQLRARAGEGA